MQNLNFDTQKQIFGYLSGEELIKVQGINKDIKNFVDNNFSDKISPLDKINCKLNRVNYDLQTTKSNLINCYQTLNKVRDQAKLIEQNYSNVNNTLSHNSKSLFDRFIIWCSNCDRLFNFLKNFEFFKKSVKKAEETISLTQRLDQLKNESSLVEEGIKKLEKEIDDYHKRQETLESKQGVLTNKKNILESEKMIFELFNGKENFDKLPVLDLKPIREKKKKTAVMETINYLKYEDLSSPIMRGVDGMGHIFFAIRDDETKKVSVYIYPHPGVWYYVAEEYNQQYFIIDTKIQDMSIMKNLKDLIRKASED